jgi:CDP-diacylglycerol--serine O-phosphatidyltransferase
MRKAVFLFPSGLTLLNLFFGVFAIISASRLEFTTAGVYVVIGGICDALDGRVARATNAGTQFGEELDSLVDAITFGLAPGMIMYFAVLNRGGWDWVWVFAFAAAAVLRLARFNIEQAGTAKTYFQGLPSPAAGITLASYYWFSQSSLYSATQTWLYQYGTMARLPWHVALRLLMAVLAALMISNVPYPTFPRTGFRSLRAIGASVVVFGAFALLLTGRLEYFFPIAVVYVAFGLVRWMLSGLFERRQPTLPYDLSEGEDDEEDEELELSTVPVHTARQHREEPATRAERPRGRADRPGRPERETRSTRPEAAARAEKPDGAERAARPDKADRPQRTEAERAARREKREKRDKREGRPDRGARPERGDRPAEVVAATGANAITISDSAPESVVPEEVIGRIPGAAEGEPTSAHEATPSRKRKRRRRRGERKDRNGAPLTEGSAGDGDQGESDGGSDDGPLDSESRSPYSSAPPIYSPSPAPTLAPPNAGPPASSTSAAPASSSPLSAPTPPSPSEPHE